MLGEPIRVKLEGFYKKQLTNDFIVLLRKASPGHQSFSEGLKASNGSAQRALPRRQEVDEEGHVLGGAVSPQVVPVTK